MSVSGAGDAEARFKELHDIIENRAMLMQKQQENVSQAKNSAWLAVDSIARITHGTTRWRISAIREITAEMIHQAAAADEVLANQLQDELAKYHPVSSCCSAELWTRVQGWTPKDGFSCRACGNKCDRSWTEA